MSNVTPPSIATQIGTLFSNLTSPAQQNNVDGANALDLINGTGAGGDGTNAAALYQQASTVASGNASANVGVAYFNGQNYFQAVPSDLQPANLGLSTTDTSLPDAFLSWSSQAQLQYLQANGNPSTLGSGSNTISVLPAANGLKVYILNNLQKTDIMKMSTQDQTNVANSAYWNSTLGMQLGLYTSSSQQASNALQSIQAEITAVTNAPTGGVESMTTSEIAPFLTELNILQAQVQIAPIVSPNDIANALQLIDKRFQRANDFAQQRAPQPWQGNSGYQNDPYAGLVSTDNNAAISNTYNNFIRQEQQIAAVQQAAANLAASPVISNKSLDVPNLIYYFELYATLQGEATINADTAEVQSLNDLLNLYSQMQNYVNTTIQDFTSTDQNTKQGFLNAKTMSQISPDVATVMGIFEDATGYEQHPLEKLYGVTRPLLDMIINPNLGTTDSYTNTNKLNVYLKDTWNSFNTSLSNTVSQLNQQSQLKMNSINDQTKQKDREFDLGNNVLSKMADTIQSIGRNVS